LLTVKTAVVIPNWDGKSRLGACLDSIQAQSDPADVVVVDNGSRDGSAEFIRSKYPKVILLQNQRNLGFAGGVNIGLRYALENNYTYAALLNNDAIADRNWLKYLVEFLDKDKSGGIVVSKMLAADGKHIDSAGEAYSIWGLPFATGRGKLDRGQYDKSGWVFGASGGASLYRLSMLKKIGLFDEDFFAYYEDVDISFRAQLAGWKVGFEPKAKVVHQIGATSKQIKGFTTYQTVKNLPWLMWKNIPRPTLWKIMPRLYLAYISFIFRALSKGQIWPVLKGVLMTKLLLPKKLLERRSIQKSRKVSLAYIDSIITHDLPSNAVNLRRLRSAWWRLRGKK